MSSSFALTAPAASTMAALKQVLSRRLRIRVLPCHSLPRRATGQALFQLPAHWCPVTRGRQLALSVLRPSGKVYPQHSSGSSTVRPAKDRGDGAARLPPAAHALHGSTKPLSQP